MLRGWQISYVGAQTLMMVKPATGSYRLLNCSAVYASGPLPAAAAAAGVAGGPPCSLLVEGTLPERAPCEHTREHCILAPRCGWCESTSQCVAANEDGVCFGSCPGGELLYASGGAPALGGAGGSGVASPSSTCAAQLSCDRCAEESECAWCASSSSGDGGMCIQATDAAMGECAAGRLIQYDSSACEAPLVDGFAGLVSQVRS